MVTPQGGNKLQNQGVYKTQGCNLVHISVTNEI